MILLLLLAGLMLVPLAWWIAIRGTGDARHPRPAEPPATLARVQQLVELGRKVEAISRCRELIGLGLKKVRDAIHRLAGPG